MSRYPLLLMFALLGLSSLVAWAFPFPSGLGSISRVLGSVLMAIGGLLVLVAAGLFRTRKTTIDPTKSPDRLVVDGIYRLSRNPMYLGMLLVLVGFPLLADSLPGLVFPLGFFCYMNWRLIPGEERIVEASFGDGYRAYKQRTRRWL